MDFDAIKQLWETVSNFEYNTPEPYHLMSISEMNDLKMGCCWDTTHYIAESLDQMGIWHEECMIFTCDENKNALQTHTFTVFEFEKKYYIAECSWYEYKGIIGPFKDVGKSISYYFDLYKLEDPYKDQNVSYSVFWYHAEGSEWEGLSDTQFMRKVIQEGNVILDQANLVPIQAPKKEDALELLVKLSLNEYESLGKENFNLEDVVDNCSDTIDFYYENPKQCKVLGYSDRAIIFASAVNVINEKDRLEYETDLIEDGEFVEEPNAIVIEGLFVEEKWRKKGYASRLLQAVLDWSQKEYPTLPIKLCVVKNNDIAKSFYEKRGFETTSELPKCTNIMTLDCSESL